MVGICHLYGFRRQVCFHCLWTAGLIWLCSIHQGAACWEPIQVFNHGHMVEISPIDDIAKAVAPLDCTRNRNSTPLILIDLLGTHRVFNVGNSSPTPLIDYIEALEKALGVKAQMQMKPIQPGDVPATSADTSALEAWVNFKPNTPVKEGVAKFVTWYREYYEV